MELDKQAGDFIVIVAVDFILLLQCKFVICLYTSFAILLGFDQYVEMKS